MGRRPLEPGSIVLIGGRSEIGLAIATRIVRDRPVILAGRRVDTLDPGPVTAAGASSVRVIGFDADDLDSHASFVQDCMSTGPIGVVLVCFGVLGDQARAETDAAHAVAIVHTDFVAQVSVLTLFANALREQGSGSIVAFSSVAGVRVRRANYVYGSAKAGLDGFASGLADALHKSPVHLLLARPGFVIGSMTAGMEPAPFSSTPGEVADAVVAALHKRKNEVWIPSVLRPVFFGMKLLPRVIWRRLPR